jgi:hypothetical protein
MTKAIHHHEHHDHDLSEAVEAIHHVARNLTWVADAITPTDASPMRTPDGGRVGSLTEAAIYAADNLGRIADAIADLAQAVRERDGAV